MTIMIKEGCYWCEHREGLICTLEKPRFKGSIKAMLKSAGRVRREEELLKPLRGGYIGNKCHGFKKRDEEFIFR